jgi:rhomboid protease GluP
MASRRCVSCGKEFESRFGDTSLTNKCPECESQDFEDSDAPAIRSANPAVIIQPSPPVTIALIAVNALVFAIMVAAGISAFGPTPQQAVSFGADFGPRTLNGEWWRLVTSMFVHFGIVHIGLNMWCLWNLGRAAEVLLGRFSYLLAYFASGICGSIASIYWHPLAAGAGASGAIFGLAGTLVAFVYLKKTPANVRINPNMLGSLGTFILFNLVYGQAIPGISNAAHIGGLVMGATVGALLPAATLPESARRARLSLVVVFAALVLVGGAVAVKRLNPGIGEISAIQDLLNAGKTDEALAQLQQLTARSPNLAMAQAMLGALYVDRGRLDEGIAALKKAAEIDPDNASYQLQLGNAYLVERQPAQALTYFQKAVEKAPKNPRAHLGLGYTLEALLQYGSAIQEFREAARLQPKLTTSLFALGDAQLRDGQYADAQETFKRILEISPNDRRAKTMLDFAARQAH